MSMVYAGGKQTGTLESKAVRPDRITGTIAFVREEEHGERKVRIDMDSRWLGSDCGNVKPGSPLQVKG